MADSPFYVSLGGGYYLDSAGNIVSGPLPIGAPVYEQPGGNSVDPGKIAQTLRDIKGLMPVLSDDENEAKKTIDKFKKLGLDESTVRALAKIGVIAGTLAAAFTVVGVFVAVFSWLFSLFSNQLSPLEALIERRTQEIKDLLRILEVKGDTERVTGWLNAVNRRTLTITSYLEELKRERPDNLRLAFIRQQFDQIHAETADVVTNALTVTNWTTSFNTNNYRYAWPWLTTFFGGNRLIHVSRQGVPVLANMPPQDAERFDHRLMVPVVMCVVPAYLAMLKAMAPEYRSTGDFDEFLATFAPMVDRLADEMRAKTLARTEYTPAHFANTALATDWPLGGPGVVAPDFDFPTTAPVHFPVGALDLCHHTDYFFSQQYSAAVKPGYYPTKFATFDFKWESPAELVFGTSTIRNPVECAEAANAQAEQDYADLLVASGYMHLVHLAATLRHHFTEPDRSESVSGKVVVRRKPQVPVVTEATSPVVFLTGEIRKPAIRRAQKVSGLVPISTQPLNRPRGLNYRIFIRTLPSGGEEQSSASGTRGGTWFGGKYEDIYRTQYLNDPNRSGFKRLTTSFFQQGILDQILLVENRSPEQLIELSGRDQLTAHTFDWYVPVDSPLVSSGPVDPVVGARGFAFDREPSAPHGIERSDPLAAVLFDFSADPAFTDRGWEEGQQTWVGRRRHVRRESVSIEWSLQWHGDDLKIRVHNSPDNRNYELFVVVEEELAPRTGDDPRKRPNAVHTVFLVPVHGQLTYVPREFFAEEERARARAAQVVAEFERRYSESVVPGPLDPIVGGIRPGDFMLGLNDIDLLESPRLQRLADMAVSSQPQILRQAIEAVDGKAPQTASLPDY
jgi:hypothetical protein